MWRSWLGGLLAVAAHGAALGEVIEIGDDGTVTRHDRPAVYLTADHRPQVIQPVAAATRAVEAVPVATSYDDAIRTSAALHGVSPELVASVAWHESRFHADAVSIKGAIGLMQLMPATARTLGVDPHDPVANIEGGTALLARLLYRYGGDLTKALAAYDAGAGAVDRYGGIPPFRETRAYVADILEILARRASSVETAR